MYDQNNKNVSVLIERLLAAMQSEESKQQSPLYSVIDDCLNARQNALAKHTERLPVDTSTGIVYG